MAEFGQFPTNCSLGTLSGFYDYMGGEKGADAQAAPIIAAAKKGIGWGYTSYTNGVLASTNATQKTAALALEKAGFIRLVTFPGGHGGFVTVWFRNVKGKSALLPEFPKEVPDWIGEYKGQKDVYGLTKGQQDDEDADEVLQDEIADLKAEVKDLQAQLKAAVKPPAKGLRLKKVKPLAGAFRQDKRAGIRRRIA